MTRKISLPILVFVFATALTITGCGPAGGQAEFTESEGPTQEELDQNEAYNEMYMQQQQRMQQQR